MSWKSRTANACAPMGVGVRLRSLIDCMAMAVDDRASARPATIAACNGSPMASPPAASAAPDSANCSAPPPKTDLAHRPEALRLELEPDHEQHQHDAELGKVQDRLDVVDEPQSPGPDRDAGEQIPEHRAQPKPLGERHAQHRRSQIDQRVGQHGGVSGTGGGLRLAPWRKPFRQSRRRAPQDAPSSIAFASCTTCGGSQCMPQKRAVCSMAGAKLANGCAWMPDGV